MKTLAGNKLVPYLFVAPAGLVLCLLALWPMLSAVGLSFTDFSMLQPPRAVGVKNYTALARDPFFWNAATNTLLYLIIVVPVLVVVPIFLAVLVSPSMPGIRIFRAIYYLPVVTSLVITGLMWKWLYQEQGPLNYLLQSAGLISAPIAWLADPATSLYAVMAVTVWTGLGYYMVVYLAGLQSIPPSLYENARLEGVSGWRQTLFITIPLLRPYVVLVAVTSSIAAIKVFEEVYVMTGGGPLNASETLVFFIYEHAFGEFEMGYAAAAGVLLLFFALIISCVNLATIGRREASQ
jgi:putative chitobiose transport system permease protein